MRRTLLKTALMCGFAAAVLAAASPARAEDEPSLDQKILRGIMEGFGLKRGGDEINYQERAPLVVPTTRALPEPEKGGQAQNNPAWPKDPDIERAKQAKRREQTGKLTSDLREEESGVLRPDQLTPGSNVPGGPRRASTGGGGRDADGGGRVYSPDELGYSGGMFGNLFGNKEREAARFTGERPRASLTDPPAGYQTPSPLQPYGVGVAKPQATDYFGTHGELSR